MPRSKRRAPADVKEVEVWAIIWRDAQRHSRERFDPDDTMVLVTYGPIIYESDDSIWVASEHRFTPEFMRLDNTVNQDRTEILKTSIIKKVPLGSLKLVPDDEAEPAGAEESKEAARPKDPESLKVGDGSASA